MNLSGCTAEAAKGHRSQSRLTDVSFGRIILLHPEGNVEREGLGEGNEQAE